jgi:nitrous oxidase accessory protein NosD
VTLTGPHNAIYDDQPLTIENIAIATNVVNSGTALTIAGGYSDATSSGLLIQNILIDIYRPVSEGSARWNTGISLNTIANVHIVNSRINGQLPTPGSTTGASDIGISITSGGTESLFKINNCNLYQWHKAISMFGSTGPEGVYITNTDAVNCNWGVYWNTSNDEEDLRVTGGHIAAYLGCIYINRCFRAFIYDMNMHIYPDSATTLGVRYGVQLNYSTHTVIHDNFIRAAATTTDPQTGVYVENSDFVKIHDNTFERFTTDITYIAGSDDCFNHHNLSLTSGGASRAPIVANSGTGNIQDEPYS